MRGWATTDFYRYSISDNSWALMAATPSTVGADYDDSKELAYTGGDYIYSLGQWGTTGFWRYSVSRNSWSSMTAAPASVSGGAALVYAGNYLYAFRGSSTADFYRYSPGSDSNFEVQNNNGLMLRDNVVAEDNITFASKITSGNAFTMSTTSTGTALTVVQSGTGDIVDFKDDNVSVFRITDGGNLVMSGNITASGIDGTLYVDGTKYTQDSAGIQNAIDDLPSTGGKVILPAATYNVDRAMDSTIAASAGGTVYVNETNNSNDATADDMSLLPASPQTDDAYWFGFDYRTRKMALNVSTAGTGTWTITWEYWNGSSWAALSGVSDNTGGFSVAGTNDITYNLPTDWTKTGGSGGKFYIRARVSAFTSMATRPLGAQSFGYGGIYITKNNTQLSGVGKSTIIKLIDNYNADVSILYNNSLSGIVVSDLAIDINQANQASGGNYGIVFDSATSSRIENCWISGAGWNRSGIEFYANESIIRNCIFSGNNSNATALHLAGNDNTVTGNIFIGPGYGLYEQNSSNCNIADNNFNAVDLRLWNSTNSSITGNKFNGTGIYLRGGSNNNVISGNTASWVNLEGSSYNSVSSNAIAYTFTGTAVSINNTSSYNTVNGNDIQTAGAYGIQEVAVTEDYNVITNNSVTGATVANISALGTHTTVSGNKTSSATEGIFDIIANAGATQTALQVTQNGTGNIVDFKDGAVSVFSISDGGNVVMSGNLTTPSINNILYVDGTKYAQTSTGIQAAIDALPAGGGKVILPAGTYNITATVTIAKSNVTLEGVGDATKLFLANGTNLTVLQVGDGSTAYSNINISSLQIDGNKANNTGGIFGIYFNMNITKSKIEDCYVHDTSNGAIVILGGSENIISNNNVSAAGNDGIMINTSNKNTVEGNKIISSALSGIYIYTAISSVVTGNYIEDSGVSSVSGFGIAIARGGYNNIGGNTLYANRRHGIETYDTAYNTIESNTIINSSQSANNTYSDIYLQSVTGFGSFSKYNNVSGNTIYASAANKSKYGIEESEVGSDYNSIQDNVISGPVSGTVYILGAHTSASGNKTSASTEGLFDIATSVSATQTALSVAQNGTGDIVNIKDGATSVFTIADGGNVTMNARSFTQNAVNPVHKGSIIDAGSLELDGASSIYVSGKYAYVASMFDDGVEILDISNPAAPTHVGAITDTATTALNGANSIYVQGRYAYVASYDDDGVEILDISNPAAPTHVGAIFDTATTELYGASSIYVSGKYAYVTSADDDGVEILDISNPAAPTHVGAITDDDTTELDGAFSIYVSGKYAYVTGYDDHGLEILDISNPAVPTHVGATTDDATTALGCASSIFVQGKYAYVTSYLEDGVEILELSGFDLPTANIGDLNVGTLDVTDNANIANNLSVGNSFNVGPGGIYSAGGVFALGEISGYASSTRTALTIAQNSTGNIVDFKDGAVSVFKIADGGNVTMNALSFTQNAVNPVPRGSIADDGTAATALTDGYSIYVQGKYAYVASTGDDGVEILDISNPDSPTHVGVIYDNAATALNGANAIYVSGKYAYVTSWSESGVEILDISNPALPTHVGAIFESTNPSLTALDGPQSIYVQGKYAYVASRSDSGVEILDISNPALPTHVGSILDSTNAVVTALSGATSIYVQGKYAYVASSLDNGVEILDISNPANPTHVGAITDSGPTELDGATSIYVSGKYAYIASSDDAGVEILNISNPASPTHVGAITDTVSVPLEGPYAISVSGRYAYIVNYWTGSLVVYDVSNPASPVLSGYVSNNGSTIMQGAVSIFISGKYAYVTCDEDDGVQILELAGFDLPTANIGDLNVSTIDVTDNANIANNLYVGNGLNVGPGGIYATGPISTYNNSAATALTVSQSGTGDLMDVSYSGISIFNIGQATVDITRPLDLQVEGDTGLEYNLNFLNNATSYINSAGPLTISGGDSNSYENLTLTTSGTGDVIVDISLSLYGFRILGTGGKVFSVDPSGNVVIGGVDSNNADLTVKRNITTQGGNIILNNLATPTGVTVTPVGTSGATSYGYRVSAINGNGETLAAATVTTATGNATLSASNYNRIVWNAVAGATGYKIYGRTGSSELYMATVNSPTLYYSDTGTATPSGALPTSNTTGGSITYPTSDGPVRTMILDPADTTLPTTDGAAQTKVDATNNSYSVLDYNDTTNQSAYWSWTMPDSYDGGVIDVTYYWSASATTGNAIWCFQSKGIATDGSQALDTALGTAACSTSAAAGSANYLTSITQTKTTSNFSAGQYVTFKIYRDASNGSDDMTGDARLVKIKLEYHVKSESD